MHTAGCVLFIHSFWNNIAKVAYNIATTIPIDYKLGYAIPEIVLLLFTNNMTIYHQTIYPLHVIIYIPFAATKPIFSKDWIFN